VCGFFRTWSILKLTAIYQTVFYGGGLALDPQRRPVKQFQHNTAWFITSFRFSRRRGEYGRDQVLIEIIRTRQNSHGVPIYRHCRDTLLLLLLWHIYLFIYIYEVIRQGCSTPLFFSLNVYRMNLFESGFFKIYHTEKQFFQILYFFFPISDKLLLLKREPSHFYCKLFNG